MRDERERSRRGPLPAWGLGAAILWVAACSGSGGSSASLPPGMAANPDPANGAVGVPVQSILSWDAAPRARSYEVFFGTTLAPPAVATVDTPTYDPGSLLPGTRYFWRVDSLRGGASTPGEEWSFITAPEKVTGPSPADGETAASPETILSWSPAAGAVSYDVFFGQVSPPSFVGTVTGTSFDPGLLRSRTTYSWRVDSTVAGGRTTGDEWSFTTHTRGEDRTLVIDNVQSPVSQAIASYYLSRRSQAHRLSIDAPAQETVNRTTYETAIRDPILAYLQTTGMADAVWYIVLTKGVPLRISGNSGSICVSDERASVDSELAHLDPAAGLAGKIFNPFFGSTTPFDRPGFDMYLVCRLTGYETDGDGDGIPDDVKALIDRGHDPVPGPTAAATGQFVLDIDPGRDSGGFKAGNDWMRAADADLSAAGFTVTLDETTTYLTGEPEVMGYASWGSNDGSNNTPPYPTLHDYIPGAVVTTYVSTNARSFQTGTTYGQSLVADLIAEGVTGANGHVFEPCLDAVSQPQMLLVRYTQGWNLAESYYSSIQYLSWMNVIVGDPLCSPWD